MKTVHTLSHEDYAKYEVEARLRMAVNASLLTTILLLLKGQRDAISANRLAVSAVGLLLVTYLLSNALLVTLL